MHNMFVSHIQNTIYFNKDNNNNLFMFAFKKQLFFSNISTMIALTTLKEKEKIRHMNKKERHEDMIQYINTKGTVYSSLLHRKYKVTEMTIRRDLKELSESGKIIRIHGGAMAIDKIVSDTQTTYSQRMKINSNIKESLANFSLNFIHQNDCIFLGSGSTIQVLTDLLSSKPNITVVTDAINVAYTLSEISYINVICLGGELRGHSLATTGSLTENNLKMFQINKAFIGINGIDETGNLYTSSIVESGLLEQAFNQVEDIYVLADSSKLFHKDFVAIRNNKPYKLITDKKMDDKAKKRLEQNNIQVYII